VLPSLGAAPIPTSRLSAIVAADRLNMRSGPGINYDVVAGVDRDQQIAILQIDFATGWARVERSDGVIGWVNVDFIQYLDDSFIPAPVQGTTLTGVNLRTGPATAFSILDILAWGTIVDVIGRTADGTWLQVRVDDQVGWVSEALVADTTDSFEDVPVTR
jgi:N-acetylmuramoyl-L-alanine amidase